MSCFGTKLIGPGPKQCKGRCWLFGISGPEKSRIFSLKLSGNPVVWSVHVMCVLVTMMNHVETTKARSVWEAGKPHSFIHSSGAAVGCWQSFDMPFSLPPAPRPSHGPVRNSPQGSLYAKKKHLEPFNRLVIDWQWHDQPTANTAPAQSHAVALLKKQSQATAIQLGHGYPVHAREPNEP